MYTDPSDFNMAGEATYPSSWWMPDTGVQRGTVGPDGDFLTPFYPAKGTFIKSCIEETTIPIAFTEMQIRL